VRVLKARLVPLGEDSFSKLTQGVPVATHESFSGFHGLFEIGVVSHKLVAFGRLGEIQGIAFFDMECFGGFGWQSQPQRVANAVEKNTSREF